MIEFGHGTHTGLRRTRNEDTYYADASLGLYLVADGMGGHQHGEVASALVRDAVATSVRSGRTLVESIRSAAADLILHTRDNLDPLPMGTTIAALHIAGDKYSLAWVGDSRIYLLNKDFRQISHDHSLVQALIESGQLDPAQASRHPQRNVLTQALGVTATEQLHIGVAAGIIQTGMAFLLCSDGLTEGVTSATIEHTVKRTDLAAQECVDQLIIQALDAGGDDNISVILIRCL